ncbi:hypothetical protein [Halopseudomonas pelagia]|uniref:hypothetical protein n=1 Tax=Halopseudomonas pelagia TaxID=553151 RepID=UPI0003B2E9CB|nr:hypothetical protein [Halopseudomonas pelagia]
MIRFIYFVESNLVWFVITLAGLVLVFPGLGTHLEPFIGPLLALQPARQVNLAQFMDISGFRGVFGGEIGSVTSKHFRLDDNGIPVYIPYPWRFCYVVITGS